MSEFSGYIEYAPRLLLIDDSAGRVEICCTALAGPTDGWPLAALGVRETLQSCRASVMERKVWRKHDLSLLLLSLGALYLHHHAGRKAE